ncbi:hypothetical protein COL27_32545, partial [Bacillus sp. AFS075960]
FNPSTTWESSYTAFNSNGQETSYETFAGSANSSGVDVETGLTDFNAATGDETSYTAFNAAGQETSYETYAGDVNSSGTDVETGHFT